MPRRPSQQGDVGERASNRPCSAVILVYTAFTAKALGAVMNKRSSLSSTQHSMLLALMRKGKQLRVNQVAKALNINHSTVSVQAAKLEALGLVKHRVSEDDNRGVELIITSRGKEAVKQTDKIIIEVIDSVWQPLTSAQKKSMLQSAVNAVGKSRIRYEDGIQRADTAYAEGMLMSFRAFQSIARLHGLSYFEATALASLDMSGATVSKGRLAELLLIKANHLSQICEALAKRGLISEEKSEKDRRLIKVKITKEGRERIRRTMIDMDRVITNDLYESSPEEQAVFRTIAQAIVENEIEHRKHGFGG